VVGEWVFIAAVYDQHAGEIRLHVNDQISTRTGTLFPGEIVANIGSNPRTLGGSEFFTGRIDNVFIYDEALSESEIEDIRLNGASAILPIAVPSLSPFGLSVLFTVLSALALANYRRGRVRG